MDALDEQEFQPATLDKVNLTCIVCQTSFRADHNDLPTVKVNWKNSSTRC